MKKDDIANGKRFEKSFKGSRAELKEFFRKLDLKLFTNKLFIDGNNVIIPANQELDYKIKYDIDNNYSVSIKISWKNSDSVDRVVEDENDDF
jgi:hypothetical protein